MLVIRLITAILLTGLAIGGCETKRMKAAIATRADGRTNLSGGLRAQEILTVLEQAEVFEVVSLDPRDRRSNGTGEFRGFRELGRTRIRDRDQRRKLIDALIAGLREGAPISGCTFQPRQAIHCVKDGGIFDEVICFHCGDVLVYNGENFCVGGKISRSPLPVFDEVLNAAGVPLASE